MDKWTTVYGTLRGGFWVEVNASAATARNAIRQREERGDIRPGEFTVEVREDAGQSHVYVVRNKIPVVRKQRHRSHTVNLGDVVAYIMKKRNLEHTLAEIQREFLGKIGSPRSDPGVYYPAYFASKKARKLIEEKEGGRFAEERRPDGTKFYRFQRS